MRCGSVLGVLAALSLSCGCASTSGSPTSGGSGGGTPDGGTPDGGTPDGGAPGPCSGFQPGAPWATAGPGLYAPGAGPCADWSGRSPAPAFPSAPSLKWAFTPPSGQVPIWAYSGTIAADGTIYMYGIDTQQEEQTLDAVSPDGTLKWTAQSAAGVASIAHDGTLYVTGGGSVAHLSPDGTTMGTIPVSNAGPMAATGSTLFFTGSTQSDPAAQLFAVGEDGSTKWTWSSGYADPGVAGPMQGPDGTLYVVAWDTQSPLTKVVAIDPATGKEQWTFTPDKPYWSGSAVAPDGTVYLVTETDENVDMVGALIAIEPGGKVKWEVPGPFFGVALGVDGAIYTTLNGDVAILNPADASTRKTIHDAGYPLPCADGSVYVVNGAYLASFDAAGNKAWQLELTAGGGGFPDRMIGTGPDGTLYVAAYTALLAYGP